QARVEWKQWQFGMKEWTWPMKIDPPDGHDIPSGGVLLVRLGRDEFLITGRNARISFAPANPLPATKGFLMARVEEGRFDAQGRWIMDRLWNGDQTDYGLNFTTLPQLLRVK